jgi:Domain of unknown function (DUF4167)
VGVKVLSTFGRLLQVCAAGNGRYLRSCTVREDARLHIDRVCCSAPYSSEIVLEQGPPRKPFRPNRSYNRSRPQGNRPPNQRPPGIHPLGNVRHAVQNARQNYERYTNMAKDAARRGDAVEAENCYQHAEHYFRVMSEQGS